MNIQEKADAANTGSIQSINVNNSNESKGNGTEQNSEGKELGMLRRFALGARLHRFQAESLGDHVLPTTVSDLQLAYSIRFSRQRVKVPNRFGSETSVCLYWLEGDDLEKARRLLGIKEAA